MAAGFAQKDVSQPQRAARFTLDRTAIGYDGTVLSK
jgi:hypothetical protein